MAKAQATHSVPHIKGPLQESMILHRAIVRQKDSLTRKHYAETAGRVTEKWKPSGKVCDCDHQDDGPHNRVSIKTVAGKWGSICPIKYYIWLGWKAITERRPAPSEELYWQLLGKPMPQREESSAYEHS